MKIVPTILCGGDGQRLWPLSRSEYPKQFYNLGREFSLFQQSVLRPFSCETPVVVTNDKYRFIVRQQLQEIGLNKADVIIEPSKKNTAPSTIAAALHISNYSPDAIMLIMPSDHYIPDTEILNNSIQIAAKSVKPGQIICFGIKPDRPETAYGYINLEMSDEPIQKVNYFIEKPIKENAEKFVKLKNYFWNAGIFMVRASDLLEIAKKLDKRMFEFVHTSYANLEKDLDFIRLNASSWEAIYPNSFDYAFMENSNNIGCITYPGFWTDLGDWNAVVNDMKTDPNGNIIHGNAHQIDCKSSVLWAENKYKVLTGIGLNNIIAVAMDDVVMISDRSKTQTIKMMVEKLKSQNIQQATKVQHEHRQWGWFHIISENEKFKVKLLYVLPNKALSLQSHEYRNEHWIVVSGKATVIRNDEKFILKENEATYINVNDKHQLINQTENELIIVEIQTGEYFGEDDIIRYADQYSL